MGRGTAAGPGAGVATIATAAAAYDGVTVGDPSVVVVVVVLRRFSPEP